MLANPYPNESVLLHLAADGRSVLVERRLSSPQHCPHDSNRFGRGPRCVEPPLEPVDDVLVALHDLKTGIPIWTLRRWFSGYPRYQVLALSDDGAFALASLPVPNSESATRLELLSMLDGEVLQTFPEAESAGFARGGHIVWARRGEMTTLYELKR
jgi:hypothetical protein